MAIQERTKKLIGDLRRSTSFEELMNGAVSDIEFYSTRYAQTVRVLQAIMSRVKRIPSGDYCIVRKQGIELIPTALNDALKDAEAWLNTIENE